MLSRALDMLFACATTSVVIGGVANASLSDNSLRLQPLAAIRESSSKTELREPVIPVNEDVSQATLQEFSSNTLQPARQLAGEQVQAWDHAKHVKANLHGFRIAAAENAEPTRAGRNRTAARLTGLEEVVVTAQKREERLQDVPISITAVTMEDIDRRGLVSAEDYLRGIPGVNYVEGGMGGGVVIRGLETNPQNPAAVGRAVATYFGETSVTGTQGGVDANDIKLVDIARVEVLRGPQGTAFGNSALGGAIRIIPAAPRLDRFEGKLAANYSVTSGTGGDNHMIQGVANLPLVQDRLAIRASAFRFEDSGYYRNVAGSDPTFQAISNQWDAQAFATDADEIGGTLFTGGRIAALFRATDNLTVTLTYLTQETERDLQAQSGTDGLLAPTALAPFEQARWQIANEQVMRGARWGLQASHIDLVNLTAEYDLNWSSLVATVSHIEGGGIASSNLGGGLPWSGRNDHKIRQNLSGEVRLATQLTGAWNFLVGLYGEEIKKDHFFDAYWFGSQPSPFAGVLGPVSFLGAQSEDRELSQKAGFAEVSWKFHPALTLTGGARFFEYDSSTAVITNLLTPSSRNSSVSGETSGDSFKTNLTYKPNENGMVYAGWSQGFRLGLGPQSGLPVDICDRNSDGIVDGTSGVTIGSTRFVDPDSLDNYELGAKLGLLDERLTIAADIFRIEWEGLPFNVRSPSLAQGGCELAYTANVGRSTSEGVELQANIQATEDLRIALGGSWIDAKLTEDIPAQGFRSGDQLPGSPEYTANLALQYAFGLAGYDSFIRVDSIYVGHFYNSFAAHPQTEAGGYVKVDLAAQVTFQNFGLKLFLHNLTDADEFTLRESVPSGVNTGYRLRPRTIGLQLDYNF